MLKTLIFSTATIALIASPADARHRHHHNYYYAYPYGSYRTVSYGYTPFGYVPMHRNRNYIYGPRYHYVGPYGDYRDRHHWRGHGDWDDQGEDNDDQD